MKFRIIPVILWDGPSAVKGERFKAWRKLGPVMPAINIYVARGVDEIILLNLAPNSRGADIDYHSIALFFKHCNLPLTYGGGVNSMSQIEQLLSVGVDKISLGSSAYNNEGFISEITREFGSQFVTCSIDYKKNGNDYLCYSKNGMKCEGVDPIEHVKKVEQLGVGEILMNSIDHEGMMEGYDIVMLEKISKVSKIPIICAGGAGDKLNHFSDAASAGASAVAASSTFLFTEITSKKIAMHLNQQGFKVRV